MRFSIAACVLTKAAATSSTLKPHRMWSMSATCATSGRRGWQQENIMRSSSSRIASVSSNRLSSGAEVRAVRSRRSTSIARFLAVAMSHAEGLSGTPRNFHTSSARQKASCTTSSASARLCTPKIRVSVATIRPASRRNRCSCSSITCPS